MPFSLSLYFHSHGNPCLLTNQPDEKVRPIRHLPNPVSSLVSNRHSAYAGICLRTQPWGSPDFIAPLVAWAGGQLCTPPFTAALSRQWTPSLPVQTPAMASRADRWVGLVSACVYYCWTTSGESGRAPVQGEKIASLRRVMEIPLSCAVNNYHHYTRKAM